MQLAASSTNGPLLCALTHVRALLLLCALTHALLHCVDSPMTRREDGEECLEIQFKWPVSARAIKAKK